MLSSYLLRYGMVNLNFPADLVRSELFNPQVFASSRLNVSLGDLILNEIVLLILCVHLFRNYKSFTSLKFIYRKNALAWVLSVVSALCVLYATLVSICCYSDIIQQFVHYIGPFPVLKVRSTSCCSRRLLSCFPEYVRFCSPILLYDY